MQKVGSMICQLQQLYRSEFSLCLPVNDFKGGIRFAEEEQAFGSLLELGGDRVGHDCGGFSALL